MTNCRYKLGSRLLCIGVILLVGGLVLAGLYVWAQWVLGVIPVLPVYHLGG